MAGLAAAVELAGSGLTVQVLEASATTGGRVRGRLYQGEPADIGFQTIMKAYPTVSRFMSTIGVEGSQLHTFERRLVVHDGTAWRRLKAVGQGGLATSSLLGRGDAARIAKLAVRAGIGGARELDGGHDQSALEMFREAGIGATAIDGVLRPLLGSMLLDRSLDADAGYVRFLLGMMARGPAVLPVDGIGMIVDRAVTALTTVGGMIWTDTNVARIDIGDDGRATGVTLEDGRTINAGSVIVATSADAARRLLAGVDDLTAARLPSQPAGCVSASFALETPLYRDATVLLNGAEADGTDRLDLICQTSNVTRPGSPGPHILVAQSATLGWSSVDPDRYAHGALARLRELIPGYDWDRSARLIDATDHPTALYRIPPGVRENLPGPRTMIRNLVIAGDTTTHPSLEGAIGSGMRAAQIVADLVR